MHIKHLFKKSEPRGYLVDEHWRPYITKEMLFESDQFKRIMEHEKKRLEKQKLLPDSKDDSS